MGAVLGLLDRESAHQGPRARPAPGAAKAQAARPGFGPVGLLPPRPSPAAVLQLQRTAGNSAVARLLRPLPAPRRPGGIEGRPAVVQRNGGNAANTSQGSGIAPVATSGGSDKKEQAMALIDRSTIPSEEKQRAKGLIGTPEAIDQSAFGVCGLVAILVAIARADPVRFAGMLIQALGDSLLRARWMYVYLTNATPEHKQNQAHVEFLTAQWLARRSLQGGQEVKQQVVKGGDGQTKEKTFEAVVAKQRQFSNQFEIEGWENTKGHFAFTTGGLNYLLGALGGDRPSYKIKVTDFARDYQVAKARAGGSGSVLASVTNTDFYKFGGQPIGLPKADLHSWVQQQRPPQQRARVLKDPPKFVHWVIIDDVVPVRDGYLWLKIWTWANHFPALVHRDVIGTYIYSLIAAQAEH